MVYRYAVLAVTLIWAATSSCMSDVESGKYCFVHDSLATALAYFEKVTKTDPEYGQAVALADICRYRLGLSSLDQHDFDRARTRFSSIATTSAHIDSARLYLENLGSYVDLLARINAEYRNGAGIVTRMRGAGLAELEGSIEVSHLRLIRGTSLLLLGCAQVHVTGVHSSNVEMHVESSFHDIWAYLPAGSNEWEWRELRQVHPDSCLGCEVASISQWYGDLLLHKKRIDAVHSLVAEYIQRKAVSTEGVENTKVRRVMTNDLDSAGTANVAACYVIEGMGGGGNNYAVFLSAFQSTGDSLVCVLDTTVGGALNPTNAELVGMSNGQIRLKVTCNQFLLFDSCSTRPDQDITLSVPARQEPLAPHQ